VTRNWVWDYARDLGLERFWTIDDNVKAFFRFNRNLKVPVADGAIFRAIEDFVGRYENVPLAGMHYFMFVKRKYVVPPIQINTRVYSNMLIQTDARDRRGRPFRNEGFFNDDTDLCLRVLKDGQCTIVFNAFLAEKAPTMTVPGGMTPFYQGDGRRRMAEELRRKHPDVVKVTRKWGRWQHHVDYRPFRGNPLRRRPDAVIPAGPNEYGMRPVRVGRSDVEGGKLFVPGLGYPGDPVASGQGGGGPRRYLRREGLPAGPPEAEGVVPGR
jgi:hypothetical protein